MFQSRKIEVLRSTIARPADNTVYAAGDEVSNNATAGSVVRMTFRPAARSGRIVMAALDLTPASGNAVTTASDMEVLVFKTDDVPAAVGDNVTNPIAAAVRALAVGGFRFDDTGWTGPLGTVAAGASQYQAVAPTLVQPLAANVPQYPWQPGYLFHFNDDETATFTAVLRALAAWTPTGIVNTFGLSLGIETI
jgi:hypothetical protein